MSRYFIIYKPYRVLSQFSFNAGTSGERKQTLKDFFHVPQDVYPVGRLDYDSEGLLILTNDRQLNHRLLHPSFAHEREYWVQVEGTVDDAALERLGGNMEIRVHGRPHLTSQAIAERFDAEPPVPTRFPPIRFRRNIPASWIRVVLTEGKHHQVRKMTAQAGFPTLRLLRHRIEGITLNGLLPGHMHELGKDELYKLLFQ